MGMVCHLRQITHPESVKIDVTPEFAYELILGPDAVGGRISAEKATELVNSLHERYSATLERIRLANINHVPNSEEDINAHRQWLAEFQALTAPWSSRNRRKKRAAGTSSSELQIDKSWHGIHFLLTGQADGGGPPCSLAILGGKEVPDRKGLMPFGPARKLSSEDVQEVAKALATIPALKLLARYDAAEMLKHEIYAAGQDSQEDQACFGHFYEKVRAFYQDASKNRNAMLIYLT